MDVTLIPIFTIVFLALSFDFINGFHDTANSIATSVSTRALAPRTAIILASTMNFIGAITFTGVAKTIGGSIADPTTLEHGTLIVIAALISAIIWNLITWWYGIPSSSSHALIGSLVGAVVAAAGLSSVHWKGFTGILEGLIASPIIALIIGFLMMSLFRFLLGLMPASPHKVNSGFRGFQVFTAALQSFTHGTNDAQKAMGIITFALVAGGFQESVDHVPMWVRISCATAMGLGTAIGGWKIIKTVGGKIMKIEPVNGAAADLSSALIIFTFTKLGLPVSTTHVISSAIMGVGAAKRVKGVKWGVAQRIVLTWIITLPICAVMAAIIYWIIHFI
ncbi:inorganic phosphate transporter [Ammoniphilus resinae]|uniref:PiT family inorganic phosphate transporter n=1 Tax=Ammoniphilus resinae TaxID=861532 RepID=A0ABS4GRR1_9BACL|nr:inorganic phosphate transporter [Ammoniphilus resinae]MBP1932956.1 PiT family inorganic phosphate transporter [Ammoniphilus resinae]